MRQTIVAQGIQKWFGSGRDRTPIVRGVNLSDGLGGDRLSRRPLGKR